MEKHQAKRPVIYIDSQKVRELDHIIAKQTPTINIDSQKAHDLDRHLALQKLYYHSEDCATRYKDFIFLTSKSSEEVAEAFKSIYDNPDKPFNWPQKIQYDKGTEFMGYVTLLMDKHDIKIQKIIARFRHTSFTMIDHYAGLFKYRVFKNQYSIEFFLPTGKCCRKCEQFARKIVDNINNSPTQLIEMSLNDATKLERIYSKPSKIVVGRNPPIPVLYYLDDSGPQCPFVREQLMHIKEEPMLPPRHNRISYTEICGSDHQLQTSLVRTQKNRSGYMQIQKS
ncbi:hypothetical protein RIR_jg5366.t1 [Rhizophagus irregularis DAOM 181602=DAOM 197198]|nr:hypothetical protein RIR_jg5366.t1 [Rhizophagus irregularis DAOM 181602=DAOM 197198]